MTPEDVKNLIENSGNLTTTHVGYDKSRLGVEEQVGIENAHRDTHVFVNGPTGVGKSENMEKAALQDIHSGHGVVVMAPENDIIDQILGKIPADRLDDLIYLNPNRDPVSKINLLEPYVRDDMTRSQLENQKSIIKDDVVDLVRRRSKEWGDQFGRDLENIVLAFLDNRIRYGDSCNLRDVYDVVRHEDLLEDLIDNTADPVLEAELTTIKNNYSEHRMEPLIRRLGDFVRIGTVKRVIDAGESSIDFTEVLDEGKILLVALPTGDIGPDATQIIGSIILSKIWSASQARTALPPEERQPARVYIDELHSFAGNESTMAKMLSQARKYRVGMWLMTQDPDQLEKELRDAVFTNCRTKIVFNVSGSDELHRIARNLRGIDKDTLTALDDYRAVLQKPRGDALVFTTLPPYDGVHDDAAIETIKTRSTVADEAERQEASFRREVGLGPGGNAGEQYHARLLKKAKAYLESRPEVVRVNITYQEIGEEKSDGEVIQMNGVANLEAEASTVDNPARVLKNFKRAIDADRQCIFVVNERYVDRLKAVITDPVNRRGDDHVDENGSFSYYMAEGEPFTDIEPIKEAVKDGEYRLLVLTERGNLRDHAKASADECPKLNEFSRNELETECMYRDDDGHCSLLDAECVLDYGGEEAA